MEVAGAYAMFDGQDSPLTQTFGLGMVQPVTGADLERIEEFFWPAPARSPKAGGKGLNSPSWPSASATPPSTAAMWPRWALPGSSSQRNAERQAFQIAYTRIKWRRRPTPK